MTLGSTWSTMVAAWLTPSDSQSRKGFATLARLWHIPVMLYLAGLFVIVLIRPGGVLFPVLEATAEVLAAPRLSTTTAVLPSAMGFAQTCTVM